MPSPEKKDSAKRPTVVCIGTTGEGKSTFCNLILSKSNEVIEEHFVVGHEQVSSTEKVIIKHGFLRGDESKPLTIIDTPGLDDSEGRDSENLDKIVEALHQQGQVSSFVLVRSGHEKRFTKSVCEMLKTFELAFGVNFWKHLMFKVKTTENVSKWNKQLMTKFPSANLTENAPTIQVDCEAENAIEEAQLDTFYKFLKDSPVFDCRTVDKVKLESEKMKAEKDKIQEEKDQIQAERDQMKAILESLQFDYSRIKTGATLNKSKKDDENLKKEDNEERDLEENKNKTVKENMSENEGVEYIDLTVQQKNDKIKTESESLSDTPLKSLEHTEMAPENCIMPTETTDVQQTNVNILSTENFNLAGNVNINQQKQVNFNSSMQAEGNINIAEKIEVVNKIEQTFFVGQPSTIKTTATEVLSYRNGANDFDDRQSWELCRDWLVNDNITKHSDKVPGLKALREELDLYNYLKDGTELCRLLRLLPEDDAADEKANLTIVYSTNGVSILEESNVKSFLQITNMVKGLKNIFGKYGQKALQNYDNFSSILQGLSKLSKYVEKTTGVQRFKFSSKNRRKKCNLVGRDMIESELIQASIYENAGQTQKDGREAEGQYNLYIPINEEPDNLTKAVEGIVSVHKSYFKNIQILKDCFVDRANHNHLKSIFNLFNIDALINCHSSAFNEFDLFNIDYAEIANCFERLSIDFIIAYSKFVGLQKRVNKLINDIRSNDSEIEDELTDMEQGKNLKNKMELFFSKQRVDLSSLLMLPFQHIMRYPMMLENVQKMARKEKRQTVETSAKRAAEIMKNVALFICKYERESSYQETINALKSNIRDLPQNLDASGNLEHELEVEVKMRDESHFMSRKFLCFEETIIIVDIIKDSQYIGTNFLGMPKKVSFEILQFSGKMFPIKKYEIIQIKPSEDHFLLQVDDLNANLDINKESSFELKFSVEEFAKLMQRKLTILRDKALKGVESGDLHKDHKFERFRQKGESTLDDLKRCGLCSAIIPGRFQIGIRCTTCDKIYHTECFKNDDGLLPEKVLEQENYEILESFGLNSKVETEDEFWVNPKEMNREEAIERLVTKRPGTYLFRKNQGGLTMISRRMNQERSRGKKKKDLIVHHILDQKEYDGRIYQWLRKGESFTNSVDLVNYYCKDYALFYPINSQEAFLSEAESSDDDNVEEELYNIITVPLKSHTAYLYPDMSAPEAAQKLMYEPFGTFLIRAENGEDHRISYKSADGVKHFMLYKDERGQYYVEADKLYPSIEDIIEHLRGLGMDEKGWLGNPLFNPDAQKSVDEESELEDPSLLPYYYGIMGGIEAETVLKLADKGSFLLRMNGEGKFRVSYQTHRKIQHMVIHHEDDEYFVSRDDKFDTMGKLIKHLIEESPLIKPLLVKENTPKRVRSLEIKKKNPDSVPVVGPVPFKFDHKRQSIQPPRPSITSSPSYIDLGFNKTIDHASGKFLNHGEIDAPTAARMLRDKPIKSWYLRSKIPEFRVSLKKEDGNVTHIVIKEEKGKFSCRSLPSNKTASSLDEMITNLIDEEVIEEELELKLE